MAEQSYAVTDPAMLRALAHPLRQRIMWELAARDHLRAADLAAITGEPANSVSFHLRTLAKAGLIAERPEHARDSRDRVWGMAHPEGIWFPGAGAGVDAGAGAGTGAAGEAEGGADADAHDGGTRDDAGGAGPHLFMAERLAWLSALIRDTLPQDPRTARMQYLGAAVLTKDEALQMENEVIEVFERWRAHGAAAAAEHPDDPDRAFHFTAAFVANPRPDTDPAALAAPDRE